MEPTLKITHKELWFDELIKSINNDKTLYKLGALEKKKKQLYDAFINNDTNTVLQYTQNNLHKDATQLIIIDFLNELKKAKHLLPATISIDLSDNKLKLWAVVNDTKPDYESIEDHLLLSVAKINAQYYTQLGYYVSLTIVYTTDNIPNPPDYKPIKIL